MVGQRKITNKKSAKCGGSYASDDVGKLVNVAAYEKMEFLMKGGNPVPLRKGGGPPLAIPASSQDMPPSYPLGGTLTSMAQPLANDTPYTTNMTFPSYFGNFNTPLSGVVSGGRGKRKVKN